MRSSGALAAALLACTLLCSTSPLLLVQGRAISALSDLQSQESCSQRSRGLQGFDKESVYRSAPAQALGHDDGRGGLDVGWVDPRVGGGSCLDLVGNGLREPINAIISGKSDAAVLSDAGLRDYVRTIGFSFECLDLHLGGLQRADLGDGQGWQTELFEFRQTQLPGAPGRWVGACWESLYGGNHFRAWKQNGTLADSGAWFLAVSKEKNLKFHHTIDKDGYNAGRDMLVEAALKGGKWKIWKWRGQVEWVEGLLDAGRHGINHNVSQDGRVAVITVDRVIDIGFGIHPSLSLQLQSSSPLYGLLESVYYVLDRAIYRVVGSVLN
ncbi:hypothetical protein IE81DRAFT_52854 [Ceraceosorus guamensis]|uniref:Uncharacterized protein n=1 Tax=Ceraceosorus guamensis TaxID=1522189 RepID=A0A316W2E1_9BASI|nr:hypothetical protein IE81DRAFT_52854 [Ceraceosorus guamensis]PWN43930.1 hypothetical protein IE81DRAFT_52854 [Ceraceosorus guamensis]